MKRLTKDILLTPWLFPATFFWWVFYILPLWLYSKDFEYKGRVKGRLVWEFEVVTKKSWYAKQWKKWSGWSGPHAIVMTPDHSRKTPIHELQHCDDRFTLGMFFDPAYLLAGLYNLLYNVLYKPTKKLTYYKDNFFEVRARKTAGQTSRSSCGKCKKH